MAALERVGTQVVAVPLFAVLGDHLIYSFHQNLQFFSLRLLKSIESRLFQLDKIVIILFNRLLKVVFSLSDG